ncbi:hypothetical protein CBS9595_003969 [Malassezia furfur]|nr:hypothetical protein CBS9595_003969 [Malassezia furfur]
MLRRVVIGAPYARPRVRLPIVPAAHWRLSSGKPKQADKDKDVGAPLKARPSKPASNAGDKPSNGSRVDVSQEARRARAAMAKQMRTADDWPHIPEDSADPALPLVSPTAEDLLKQRFLHAQKRAPGSSLMMGGSGSAKDMPSFFREERPADKAEDTSLMGSSSPAPKSDTEAREADDAKDAEAPLEDAQGDESAAWTAAGSMAPMERTSFEASDLPTPPHHPVYNKFEQPFNTHVFVRRLEQGGWVAARDGASGAVPADRRHDPAEAIMDLTRSMLQERGEELAVRSIDRSDLDNRLYLFSSALSELRTEVRVRARNDAAALRSLTSLLQREVDGLSQKMQAEIERLKHDIQVDMNQRKHEVKEENNNLELDIQDLNNRFTIFLSDLKTEIEQSIKWDATRRALALVFGIVAILVSTLALADYFSRPEVMETAQKIKERKAGVSDAPRVPRHSKAEGEVESAPPPKSAEEWGLVPRYDSEGEVRYV